MSDADIIEDLIQCVGQLTRHLEAENALLAKREATALQPLAEEKSRLIAQYLEIMEVIRRNPSLVQGLPPEKRELVRHAGTVFNAVMEEHRRRVTALKIVGEGVIRSISEHVAARNRAATYEPATLPPRRQPAIPAAIAVDRNI